MSHAELSRRITIFPLTNIVIANMIGARIFTTSGLLMQDLHTPLLMLVLWLVGGIVALCGALSYAELGAAIPEAGGEYAFLSRMYHPLAGFLSGWVSLIAGFSAPIAAGIPAGSPSGFGETTAPCSDLPRSPGLNSGIIGSKSLSFRPLADSKAKTSG